VNAVDHRTIVDGLARVINAHEWDDLGRWIHEDAVWEYPQSGEVFIGLANIRAQFERYPGSEPGTSEIQEIIGGTEYALTPAYTVIAIEGSGSKGTSIIRVRYPDNTLWWVVNVYELRDGRIGHSRSYFAPDFEAPAWRAPFRAGELTPPVQP
jgi:SnoaL-like domain